MKNRIEVIKRILAAKSYFQVCPDCGLEYMPMISMHECPRCHNLPVNEVEVIDYDLTDEELLGVTYSDDQLKFNQ